MGAFGRIKFLLELQSKLGDFQAAIDKCRKDKEMLSFGQLMKTKTVWTAIGGAALNAWQYMQQDPNLHIPATAMAAVNAGVMLLTMIFRAMNSQKPQVSIP